MKSIVLYKIVLVFCLSAFSYFSFGQETVGFSSYPVGYVNDNNEFIRLSENQLKNFWAEYGKIELSSLNQPIIIEIKPSVVTNTNRFLVKTASTSGAEVGTLLNSVEREGKTHLVFETKMDYVLGFCKSDGQCKLTVNEKDMFECIAPEVKNDAIACQKSGISFGKNSTLKWNLYFKKE